MHKHVIAHRDIKPENILFDTKDEDSPIKIIDFGLARHHHGEQGDPPMKASVGVSAYILLRGQAPFNGANNDEVHKAVKRGCYRFDPEECWSDVSREAKDFI